MKRLLLSRGTSLAKLPYLIISVSANALVSSATRAGHSVYSVDCFNDVDTTEKTLQSYKLNQVNGSFNDQDIQSIIKNIGVRNLAGVIIGSGLEKNRELLAIINRNLPVLANSTEVISNSSDPVKANAILDDLQIEYPETRFSRPIDQQPWLVKKRFSCGGSHIRLYMDSMKINEDDYFQRLISGQSYSVNFLATQADVSIIGINKIWCSPSTESKFNYGGAIADCTISKNIANRIEAIVPIISKAFRLRGLCGIDFILTESEQIMILDINARPTATLELYDDPEGTLFTAHIAAFQTELSIPLGVSNHLAGHQIIYSPFDLIFPKRFDWPEWAICRPIAGSEIAKGSPICTVVVKEKNKAMNIQDTLELRRQEILNSLKTINKNQDLVASSS